MESDPGFQAALSEAQSGAREGGVPIGACLVSSDGKILGQGHNQRVQKDSAILHVRLSLVQRKAGKHTPVYSRVMIDLFASRQRWTV